MPHSAHGPRVDLPARGVLVARTSRTVSRPPPTHLAYQTQRRKTAASTCRRAKVMTRLYVLFHPHPMLLRAFSRRWSNLGPKPLIHSEGLVQMCSIGSDHGTRSCQSCVVTRKQIIMRANFLTETRSSCPYSSHPHSYPADHSNVPGTFFVSPYSLCYPQVTSAVAPRRTCPRKEA